MDQYLHIFVDLARFIHNSNDHLSYLVRSFIPKCEWYLNNQINLVRPGKKDGDVIAPNHNSRFVAVKSNSSTEFQPNKTRKAQKKNTEKTNFFSTMIISSTTCLKVWINFTWRIVISHRIEMRTVSSSTPVFRCFWGKRVSSNWLI